MPKSQDPAWPNSGSIPVPVAVPGGHAPTCRSPQPFGPKLQRISPLSLFFLAPSPSCLVFLVVAKSLHLGSHKDHLPLGWARASVIFQGLRGCQHGSGSPRAGPCMVHLCSPGPASPQPLGKCLFNQSTNTGLLSKFRST